MGAKQLTAGTLAGAVTLMAAGYLLFATVARDFYVYAITSGSATGVERYPIVFWAAALACVANSALLTLAIGTRASRLTVATGIKMGAIVSFLLWFTADLALYAITNVGNLTTAFVEPFVELVPGAVAGGVIAAVLRRFTRTTTASSTPSQSAPSQSAAFTRAA